MNTQHTPGPWSVQPLAANVWNVTHHVTAKDKDLPVAMSHGEANARLIAAAPELLASLIEMCGALEDSNSGAYQTLADARAAIAKATQP